MIEILGSQGHKFRWVLCTHGKWGPSAGWKQWHVCLTCFFMGGCPLAQCRGWRVQTIWKNSRDRSVLMNMVFQITDPKLIGFFAMMTLDPLVEPSIAQHSMPVPCWWSQAIQRRGGSRKLEKTIQTAKKQIWTTFLPTRIGHRFFASFLFLRPQGVRAAYIHWSQKCHQLLQ